MKTILLLLIWILLSAGTVFGQAPFIIKEPQDVTITASEDVLLPCIVENLPLDSMVQWIKGDFALGFDRKIKGFPRYSIIGDESLGEYNLLIKNTTIDDEDNYECQVTSHRIRTRVAKLTILVLSKGPFINNVVKGVINLHPDKENIVSCWAYDGNPAAELKWYKDNEEVRSNVTYKTEGKDLYNVSATLRLWPKEENNGQKYSCKMTTNVGKLNSTIIKSSSMMMNIQKPPSATIVLDSTKILEGASTAAHCDVHNTNLPSTSYTWYLNGVAIKGESQSKLTLKRLQRNMNGARIGCQATNEFGASFVSSMVINILYTPKLVSISKTLKVSVGETATFYCEWDSNPVSQITWYRLGTQGGEDAVLGVGNTLTMNSVQQSDAGQISCVADVSGVGRNKAKTKLVVWGKPIISSNEEQLVKVGEETAIVECRISSDPGIQKVEWSWMYGDKFYTLSNNNTMAVSFAAKPKLNMNELAGLKMKYESRYRLGGSFARLYIYNVDRSDIIAYNCSIWNSFGRGSHVTTLKGPAVGGAFLGLLAVVLTIVICVVYSSRKKRKNKHNPRLQNKNIKEMMLREEQKQIHRGNIYGNSPSASSLSSPDVTSELLRVNFTPSTQNDDGYCTEADISPWNRATDRSSSISTNKSDYHPEQAMPLLPIVLDSTLPRYPASQVDLHELNRTKHLPPVLENRLSPHRSNPGMYPGRIEQYRRPKSNSPYKQQEARSSNSTPLSLYNPAVGVKYPSASESNPVWGNSPNQTLHLTATKRTYSLFEEDFYRHRNNHPGSVPMLDENGELFDNSINVRIGTDV